MPLLYCLFLVTGPADKALDRYVALRRNAPALTVAFTYRDAKGNLLFEPRKRYRFELKGKRVDYVAVIDRGMFRDFDHLDREYDEFEVPGPVPPPSRINEVGSVFPRWVGYDDLRSLAPPRTPFKEMGPQKVGARTGDRVKADFRDPNGGSHTVDLVIDAEGRPLRVLLAGQAFDGNYRDEWSVSAFRKHAPADPARFSLGVPDGYSPFALDGRGGPVGVGSTLPASGWKAPSGQSYDLRKALPQGGIVAILSTEGNPSRHARESVARLRKAGVKVVVLADSSARDVDAFDPSGKVMDSLDVPALPLFYRVDRTGKVQAVWMGYDRAKAAEFERDVRAQS
jgi:hypothetical protein